MCLYFLFLYLSSLFISSPPFSLFLSHFKYFTPLVPFSPSLSHSVCCFSFVNVTNEEWWEKERDRQGKRKKAREKERDGEIERFRVRINNSQEKKEREVHDKIVLNKWKFTHEKEEREKKRKGEGKKGREKLGRKRGREMKRRWEYYLNWIEYFTLTVMMFCIKLVPT